VRQVIYLDADYRQSGIPLNGIALYSAAEVKTSSGSVDVFQRLFAHSSHSVSQGCAQISCWCGEPETTADT